MFRGFDTYVAPARATNQLWRLALGILVLAVLYFLTISLFVAGWTAAYQDRDVAKLLSESPKFTFLFLLTFAAVTGAIALNLKLIHKRKFRTILGPEGRLNWAQFRLALVIFLIVMVGSFVFLPLEQFLFPDDSVWPRLNTPFTNWIFLLPLIVLGLLVQTSAEEILFRGYILQQLGSRFRSPLIWAVFPSLVFGVLHFDGETYGINAYFVVLNTALVGIIAALVTAQTGNLAAAIGLHFANNFLALGLVGMEGQLDAMSLFSIKVDDLAGSYTTYLILFQTALELFAFTIWWYRFTDRS